MNKTYTKRKKTQKNNKHRRKTRKLKGGGMFDWLTGKKSNAENPQPFKPEEKAAEKPQLEPPEKKPFWKFW
jgi:hypothetical protein